MNNTAVRILVSVITIPVIILLSYFGGLLFLALVLGIGLISFYEYSLMARNKQAYINIAAFVFVFILIINSYFHLAEFKILVLLASLVLLILELFRNKSSAILNVAASLLGIFYIGLFASSIVDIREFFPVYVYGGYLIISILATIWICDSAAFFIGKSLGRNKLFPRVSPKKTWEGAIAGFIFAILAMIAAKYIVLHFLSLQDVIIIGVIVGSIGQIGDLSESLLKRDAGVKDSSNLIPGHGGIFDRFDSLLFSAPAVYLYLHYCL